MSKVALPQKLKLPSHVIEFCCAQCGECCTNKWKIGVDAISYDNLYKKFEQLGRQKELYDNILHHNVAPRIRFLENGKCPYLSSDNRCAIQLEIGEEYMLDICKVYPRHIFASQRVLEFSLSLTCRTAVKTLQQGPIHIIEADWPIKDKQNLPFYFMPPNAYTQYSPEKWILDNFQVPYYVLEDRFIKILQGNDLSVTQRLVVVGQMLDHLISGSKLPDGESATPIFPNILSNDHINNTEPDLKRHLDHLFFISNTFLLKSPLIPWSRLLRSILLTLADKPLQKEPSDEIIRSKVMLPLPSDYQQKLEQYYQPARSIVEPILENYLVNYILSKHFYLKPLHFAYYRMSFTYAAIIAFSIGYSISTNQPVCQQTILQAIYDVENIFYNRWFYPRAANLQAGQSCQQIIANGIALANI